MNLRDNKVSVEDRIKTVMDYLNKSWTILYEEEGLVDR